MVREKMQQVLRVPKREGWELKANSNEEQEVSRLTILPAEMRHAPTVACLKRFDDQCWWCGKAAQTREHLLHHYKKWRNELRELWKTVLRETCWKAGRRRHVQVSELFSMEDRDQAVMDFLPATKVGKFPRR